MRADGSEQPRALPDEVPSDPETDQDDVVAVFLVPLPRGTDVQAAQDVISALPGVTGITLDRSDDTLVVWGRRDLLSEDELAAAIDDATPGLADRSQN